MKTRIQKIEYFNLNVKDQPGEAYRLLQGLAELGINLLAFSAVPVGPGTTQLTIFPEENDRLVSVAKQSGMNLEGPHPAIIVQGKDSVGALVSIHQRLNQANINVYASTGVADGQGNFGYIIYMRAEDVDRAMKSMEIGR